MNFDADAFEERAAIMEQDGGLTRFQAETQAAQSQGVNRWEAIGNVAGRIVEKARDQREAMAERGSPNDLPGVQPHPTKEG